MSTHKKNIPDLLVLAILGFGLCGIFLSAILFIPNTTWAQYSWRMDYQTRYDVVTGCSGWGIAIACDAGTVGSSVSTLLCLGSMSCAEDFPAGSGLSCGNAVDTGFTCIGPVGCTADPSCAANTCTTSTCSDSCLNTYTGTKTDGVCTVCSGTMGNACSGSANVCGVTNPGTIQCDGSCNAGSPPAPVDVCPLDAGTQCTPAECSAACAPAYNTACTANDGCSSNAPGTFACDGTTCNLPNPDVCPVDAGLQCNLPCPASCDPYEGDPCNQNTCGVYGGTIQCNGSCSGGIPAVVDACPQPGNQCNAASNQGNACTSSANTCGMTNTGTIQCDGNCSATTPLNSACPANPGLSLTITPTFVQKGQATTLSWTATSEVIPMNCRLYGPGINDTFTLASFNGSRFTNPINAKSEFTLRCVEPITTTAFTKTVIVETTGEIQEI